MNTPVSLINRFANPGRFLALARWLMPAAAVVCALTLASGLYEALIASPVDYQQGNSVRIMYIHVPSAWMGMFVYVTMAVAAFIGLVWKHVVAELYARAAAPIGAAFTFVCLVSGALWGKPMWGAWWVWDARLTSMLFLFFLYVGYIGLVGAFDDEQKGLKAGAGLLLIGVIDIPVIKFSVDWWNTLHQPASVFRMGGPDIAEPMMVPLVLMAVAFHAFFVALVCLRLKTEITRRRVQALRLRLDAQAEAGQ